MHTALVYINILVFMKILSIQAYSHNEHGCLTWNIRSNRLILTCRLKHFSILVSVIDNHEQEYITCTLKGKINNCISRHTSKSILIDHSINTITLTIRKINESNVDGKWRCKQGKHDYETAVSTTKGVISATDIHLNGEIMNTGTTKKVKLKCHSCREPRKNYIEILINGSTVDGISYNKTIDKCSHRDGECKSHVCACHRAGNEFIRIFNVTSVYGSQYSCEMRFNDKDKESIFSMERSLYINDTVFYNTTEIRLIKAPPRGNNKKTRTKDTDNLNEEEIGLVEKRTEISVSNSLLIFLIVLAILIILVVLYTTIKKDFGKSKNNTEQTDPLVGESNESSTNSGTEGEMHEKTVDNMESDGKPSDKETETRISEPNTGEKHVCTQTTYIENKSSDSDSSPFNEANEATTSEYGSYISYAKIAQSNSVGQPKEVPESEDIFESTHQKDDMESDLAEGKTTPSGYCAQVVQNNVDEQQEEVPGLENISESTFQNDVMELNSAEAKYN